MTITITSYKTPKCAAKRGTWHCYSEREAQELINKLHHAGHEYLGTRMSK